MISITVCCIIASKHKNSTDPEFGDLTDAVSIWVFPPFALWDHYSIMPRKIKSELMVWFRAPITRCCFYSYFQKERNRNMKQPSGYRHLTAGERIRISEMLCEGESLRFIAKELGKSTSTISREIKKHSITKASKTNDCLYVRNCTKTGICNKISCTRKQCRRCRVPCKKYCPDYTQSFCNKLTGSPYVCNGCRKRGFCTYEQVIYRPELAQKEYRQTLQEKRSGFDLTAEQFERINALASPMLLKGQSPYHIKQTLGSSLPVSEATLRRMIDCCELDARNIDLRDKVRRKERKHRKRIVYDEKMISAKNGHKYTDYLLFTDENDISAVQMDCVEGTQDDHAVLLTLHFPQFHMQLAFIMDEHTSGQVVRTLDKIEQALGADLFRMTFPAILTDNGHEFMDITGMERSIYGGMRTHIFFCEPNRSDEKGACENNHKLIRYVIPKGTSLEPFSQKDISLMMNHVNSYSRKSLYGRSPYDLAMQILPDDFFILLGLEKIRQENVLLKPSLIRKNHIPPK